MAKQISMVRILRDPDGDVEDVTVGDSLAEILDVDAHITARCDLPQLETVTADDPYSMKLLKWSRVRKVYLANRQPYWYVTLRLRAKNGFGAYILKEAQFYLRHNKVVFTHNL